MKGCKVLKKSFYNRFFRRSALTKGKLIQTRDQVRSSKWISYVMTNPHTQHMNSPPHYSFASALLLFSFCFCQCFIHSHSSSSRVCVQISSPTRPPPPLFQQRTLNVGKYSPIQQQQPLDLYIWTLPHISPPPFRHYKLSSPMT